MRPALEDPLRTFKNKSCTPIFEFATTCLVDHDRVEAFIGEDFMASPYDITYITPVEEGWADGDHEGICAVVNFDGTQLTGPINGG